MIGRIFAYYRKAFSGLPVGVWAFALVLFVHRCGTMVLPFLSLHLKDHLGLSAEVAALLLSSYGIGSVGGSLLGGFLTGRMGAIRVVILSLMFTAPCFVLLLYAQSMVSAAICIMLLSVVGDAIRPAAMTATADLCPGQNLSRAYGLIRLAINLGMSIGPAIAGFMYRDYFQWIFYIDAVSCFLAAVMVWYFFGWNSGGSHTTKESAAERNSQKSRLWSDWQLLAVLLQFCLVLIVFLQTISVYPIYLRQQHAISESTIGLLFSINTVLIVLFEMVLVSAVNRFRRLPVIGVGCVLICLGFGIQPLGHGVAFICFTVVVWTFGEMLSMPILSTWISEKAPPRERGRFMGAMTAIFSAGWVIAPLTGGTLYAIHPDAVWYFGLVIGCSAAASFYWLSSKDTVSAQKAEDLSRVPAQS